MTNKKGTKRALLSSVLALVLCLSMLVGTTFAWFTDSVTSGVNKIVAGNLDIELEHYKDGEWKTVNNATDLFTGNLWEPGHTEIVYLKLSNLGTLALKYQLGINIVNETPSINVYEEEFKLSDFIQFGVIENVNGETGAYAEREDAIAALTSSTKLNAGYFKSGTMVAGDPNLYLAVVVYMPETVGNEANYKTGAAVPTIELGINLIATQETHEKDSWDELYDANANGLITIDGIQYMYKGEEFILYNVTDEYTKDTVIVPAGVTTIGGYSFENNSVVKTIVMSSTVRTIEKNAFKNSAVETAVLNEGLEEIGQFAFSQAKQLKNVNIPSTVKTIGLDAFKLTAMEEVTIPSTVTTIKSGAFREMPNLKTLTIIGENTVIGGDYAQNYIARGCPNLTTVYLLGDNISFVSGSMTFSNNSAGYAKDITVYVTAENVKTSLMAASSSTDNDANRFNVVVMNAVDETADIDTILTTAEDGATIYLSAGEYTITKSNQLADNLTVIGADGTTIYVDDNWSGSYKGNLKGDGLTLINVTVGDIVASDTTFIGCTFPYGFFGSEGNLNLTLTDCTINGKLHFVEYGTNTTTITNTTATEAEYYSAGTVEFVGCTIGTLAPVNTNTVLTGCTVNEIDYENAGSATLVIDGKYYVGSSEMLSSAIGAGATEIVLADGNYQFPTSAALRGKTLSLTGTKDVVIDTSKVDERNQFVTGANLTFEGVTLNFGTKNYMGFANAASLTYEDCAINGLQFCYGSGEYSFIDCDLNSNGAEHCVWTWGGQNVSFTGCDFTYGDRAVNCYGEGVTTNASFTDCTFTKVAGKETSGAIETNSSTLTALNLTINNCSINEGNLWWVSTWDGKGGANTYTTVDGKVTVGTAEQLAAVVAKGDTNIYLLDGVYENIKGCAGKTLTLNGSKNAVLKVKNEGEDGCDYDFGGNGTGVGNITFNGLTIDTTVNTGSYKGYAYMKGTFNDCNFVGAYSLNNANDFVFNHCTFDFKNGYFWTWGANSVTFDGCTFNGNSKTILAHGYASTVININNCAFAATEKGYAGGGTVWTAAIEIDPAGSNTYTINFTGENTITDSYAGWTRVKDGSTGHTITGLN